MTNPVIEQAIKDYDAAKALRAPWEPLWDLITKYVLLRKMGFAIGDPINDFLLYGDVFDDTAVNAANTATSTILGTLWKGAARTFRLKRGRTIRETAEVKKYFAEINRRNNYQIEHHKAGFVTSYYEYMKEQIVLGTSGFGVVKAQQGAGHNLVFKAWTLKNMAIVESSTGRIDKKFFEFEYTVEGLVEEFGFDNIPTEVLSNSDKTKKYKVLWYLRPRAAYNPNVRNPQNMPIQSLHILLTGEKVVLRDSGYEDDPMNICRFLKNVGEAYGRSCGSEGLPSIVELNFLWETLTKAIEKHLFPSLYVLDDGSFGNGTIDLSPNAVNVIDTSTRISNQAPIGVIGEVGELQSALKLVEFLTLQIRSAFFIDRLLDLNNQTRMTLGEAQIRNELRADSNGAMYLRQIEECLLPTLNRATRINFESGDLGVVKNSPKHKELVAMNTKDVLIMPPEVAEAMMKGEDVYEIEFISPAMRIIRSDELRGIVSTCQFAGAFAGLDAKFALSLKPREIMTLVRDLNGATDSILCSDEEFEEEVQKFEESQAARMQMEMEKIGADAEVKRASAKQQSAQASATLVGAGLGMPSGIE